ncbi:MAG TPA: hypothetical protein ENI17_02890 [Pseudomonas xinjiangensis]|uniref:Uncharacterized protein n=2 Tax=root TaxID=1 RepID=A0A7V1BRW2_9GAMM|nr:hypothetical protein [Halopseudomonas xinjiangensis]HEC46555.1 hypothetical protein [Halopseudomonas xinjiangensis]
MSSADPEFQPLKPVFDFAFGIEACVAITEEPDALVFLLRIGVHPFGDTKIHPLKAKDGSTKTEKVQAFSEKQFLYVCRTIGLVTRIFRYYAPTGLLLVEACRIAEEHYQTSTLELQ